MKSADIVKTYWRGVQGGSPECTGVYAMGGGGVWEIPYRHYFELRHLLRIVPFNSSMSVLELGCGNGRWAFSLSPLVKDYTAIDINDDIIDYAKNVAEERGINNIFFQSASLMEFSSDRCFDIIYFSGVSQYLEDEDVEKILINLKSCMNSNTIIIDRSTINLYEKEKRETNCYFSIYRTVQDIQKLMKIIDFYLVYQKRSYAFLYVPSFFKHKSILETMALITNMTKPFSLYLMLSMSKILDFLMPVPFEQGRRSHDFLVFRRENFAE